MSIQIYILPVFILFVIICGAIKKVGLYDAFTDGIKKAIPLVVSVFPYIAAILMLSEIFDASGLADSLTRFLSPFVEAVGIPKELTKLLLLKPFSGNGSFALLSELYAKYGADSFIGRSASVVYGSSETVFYISALYYTNVKQKKLLLPILISLTATFISAIAGIFLCKIIFF